MITASDLMRIAVEEMAEIAEEAAAQKEKERRQQVETERFLWQSAWALLGKTGDVLSSAEIAEQGRHYDNLYIDSVLPTTPRGIRMLCRTTITPNGSALERIRLVWSCYVAPDVSDCAYRSYTTANFLVKTGNPIPGNALRELWAAAAEILQAATAELETRQAEFRGTLAADLEAYAGGEKHAARVSHSDYTDSSWGVRIGQYMLVLGDEVKAQFDNLQVVRDSNVRSRAECDRLIGAAEKAAQRERERIIQANRSVLDNEPIPGVLGKVDVYRIRYAVGGEICTDFAIDRGDDPTTFIVPEEGGNVARQYLTAISVEQGKAPISAVFGLRCSREFIREADTWVHFHPLASAEQQDAALTALRSKFSPLPDSQWELTWALRDADASVADDIFLDVVNRLQHYYYYSMGDSADES